MAKPEFTLVSGRGGFFIDGVQQFTEELSLISREQRGFHIKEWKPAIQQAKGGGVFASNPLANGRQLMVKKWDNVTETLTLAISADSQDTVAQMFQGLIDILEKATDYWLSDIQNDPVYIRVRGSEESNLRYAVIYDYRIDSIANPFATPFFGCNPSTMDDIVLTIERGMWQDVVPGYGDCVEISAREDANQPVTRYDAPNANSDDCHIDDIAAAIDTTGIFTRVGGPLSGAFRNEIGVRFTAVDLDQGTTITSARVRFHSGRATSVGQLYTTIYGEDADDAATFSTYADFVARPLTTASSLWLIPDTAYGAYYWTGDISAIIQEIVDRPGWVSGNDIVIFVTVDPATMFSRTAAGAAENIRDFAAYDHVTLNSALLTINYTNSYGQEETCLAYPFVSNKRTMSSLTNVYVDDGGVFGGNLLTTALPYNLLPAVPAVNDAIYFGTNTALSYTGPFSSVVFDLSDWAEDLTITWEYYDGAAWSALTVTDNTEGFIRLGSNGVFWEQPYNWTAVAVNGITGYWVRARVSAVGGAQTPPTQQTRHIYTVVWPSVSIASDQINGDLSALAHIAMNLPYGNTILTHLGYARVVVGSRATARGSNFTSIINISDEQNPTDITVTLGNDTTFINNAQASTGRCASYASPGADAFETRVYVTIENPTAHFKGRYRVFLRATNIRSTSAFELPVQLTYAFDPAGIDLISSKVVVLFEQGTPNAAPTTMNWQLLDFGFVDIPFGRQYYARQEGMMSFTIKIWCECDSSSQDVYFHDLILIPCDEWFGEFIVPSLEDVGSHDLVNQGYSLVVDSVSVPRRQLRSLVGIPGISTTSDGKQEVVDMSQIQSVWRASAQGECALAPNTETKLWFIGGYYDTTLQVWTSYPEASLSVTLHKAQRWMGLRGKS